MSLPVIPLKLPRCNYPNASNFSAHGLLDLPENISTVDFSTIQKFRSNKFKPTGIREFKKTQILQMARMIAFSFAINEPMSRHFHPPAKKPEIINDLVHSDPFGNDPFGPWTTENIIFWFIRLFILTNPSDPLEDLRINHDMLKLSLAVTENADVIGGAFNVTVPNAKEKSPRNYDPFLETISIYMTPIMNLILGQEHVAMEALDRKYPTFKNAHQNSRIGMHFMIARSAKLPSEHTFELLAASAEHFQKSDYQYMIITGSNQWTGAACEVLGATRVHFLPFRNVRRVATKQDANENEPYSEDGYISDKDSGLMFYVMRLYK